MKSCLVAAMRDSEAPQITTVLCCFVMFSIFCIHLHAKVHCTLKVEAVLRGMAHLSRLSEASEVPSPTAERGAWRK